MNDQLEPLLKLCRAAYEEAKINYNTGKCSAEALENVRIKLEQLERTASKQPPAHRATPTASSPAGSTLSQRLPE
jgi:hypothetical protein